MEDINYRKILIAYIRHVGDMEGTDFLHANFWGRPEGLTEVEYAELMKARDESF